MENLFKCDQCENSFTEDRMTTTGGDEIYCQKCWLEKGEESKKLQMVLDRKEKEWIDLSLKEERRFK